MGSSSETAIRKRLTFLTVLCLLVANVHPISALEKLHKTWRHPESGSVIELKHAEHDNFHRKTTLSVDGTVQLEHHTDNFKDDNGIDGAPLLCTPTCDCVMDKDNNCITEGLRKLGVLSSGPNPESDPPRTDL
eukprot:m.97087 g.97087  ORF g.97087 m.97087 type:complete len:133 (+) comp12385_c0_seq1:385-783(+)